MSTRKVSTWRHLVAELVAAGMSEDRAILNAASEQSRPEDDRPPWYPRAVELCRQGYDTSTAQMLARSEWQDRQQRLDGNERDVRPLGRRVGAERRG